MVYVLEFFAVDAEEGKRILDRVTHRAKSPEDAKKHAKSVMKNVKMGGQMASVCEVKDQTGKTFGVVSAGA